jgi:uncharacterized membrane protein
VTQTDAAVTTTTEDRTLPTIVYALYLLGLVNGLTILIGLIIAYANRDNSGPRMATHYTFLIYTFWIGLIASVAAGVLVLVGGVLSIVLIGIPFLMLGIAIWCAIGIWFVIRCVVGLTYMSRGEAYPRPTNLVI